MSKQKTYNEWLSSLSGFDVMRHANCCKIAYEAGQQSRQAEVDEKDKRIEALIESWRGLKIKGIAPEHRAFENALNKCADELERVLRGEHE